ncbi:integrase [Helicobacter pylori X47-2AL]|uniref:Integrase n=1 Tax=Helicobacter pylori X47-2AL TaxID=1386083 RepID=V6L6Y0_HELPX|nr:site-specific integrase [Helicobacter pylori]EST40018.1 integrase [Helicobacter pylori X47-2AL]MUT42601.1 tyrosine-type recombinase/integrase [Helicobacter pylori]MUT74752.1 tyrosine-type recombinase/integrase [Helicobacter pylori]MUT82425.1 tyrosine-type recombinase/integrase [Helicobacter pylori]
MKNAFNLYKRDYKGEETLYLNYYNKTNKRFRVSLRKATDCLKMNTDEALEFFKDKSLKEILAFVNRLEAMKNANKRVKNAEKQTHRIQSKITILQALKRFLALKIGLKQTSINSLENVFNSIFNVMGLKESDKLKKITQERISRYHEKTLKLYKKNTIHNLNANLRSFLAFCESELFINKNPYFSITLKNAKEAKAIDPFTLEEVKTLLENAPTLRLKAFLVVAFFTGMRTGEQLALTWEDIDFNQKTITINKSLNELGQITSPKNKPSVREVDLLEPVEKILKELQASEPENKKFVFIDMPKRSSVFQRHFKKLLKALNLKDRKLYTTRHTFASLMLSQGEEAMWVSKTLGHKDLNTTYKTYSHYIPKQDKERAKFIKGIL